MCQSTGLSETCCIKNKHQGPSGTNAPRLDQMWHDHPFSQRDRTTERTVEWELEVTRKWGDLKKGVDNISLLYSHFWKISSPFYEGGRRVWTMQTLFLKQPHLFYQPLHFYWKNLNSPSLFFWKFQKLIPHLYKGRELPTMLYLFQVKKVPFTAWKIAATLSL